ncbi:MAG: TonB-dependent receptor [Betaproteobacteria bacterium]|nr:MAG: TonB-dependent receptor [Betaproteobacteria bacterium]
MNPRKSTPLKLSALAFAVATSVAAAQTAPPSVDTVIVTGTRSKDRTELTTPTPVDILSRDDLIKAAGAGGDLGAALQSLLPSFNLPRQSNSGGADHVRAAQLRGVSPDQVLVLVNGKRRHNAAIVNVESKIGKGTNPVDFNSIPISAIKRIEVLRDGAGAQYGSDAVAGVINILLDDAPGGEIIAGYGFNSTRFEPTQQRISDGETPELRAKYGMKLGNGFVNFGADVSRRGATNRAGADQIPFFEEQTAANLALAGKRNYIAGDSKVSGVNAWVNSQFALTGQLTGYAFATLNQRDSVGAAFFRYPDSWVTNKSIYPNGYRPETTGDNRDLSIFAGAKGSLGGAWDLDASLGYGRNDFSLGVRRSYNASLGNTSPTSFHLGDFGVSQLTANLEGSRDIKLAGLAKPLSLVVGAELRREGFSTGAGDRDSYAAGSVTDVPVGAQAGPGLQPADTANRSRTVVGAFADISGDIAKTVFLNAAARYDRYSDFGDALTAKLSGRVELAPGIALRGAASSNFRAPSLAQSAFSFTTTNFGDGGALTSVRTIPVGGAIANTLGVPALKAEKSNNLSAGFTAALGKQLNASIDAFQIKLDDRITLSERFSSDAMTAAILAKTGQAGVTDVNFFTNAVDTTTRGADLIVNYNTALSGGNLRLTAASSWAKTTIRNIKARPAALTALGIDRDLVGLEEQNTLTTASPSTRHVLTANWSNERFSALARVTLHGKTTRVFDFGGGFTPTQTYGAKTQLDLEGEYKFNKRLSVAIGGNNITDQYPTRSIDDISYFGNLPYDVLSPIGFNGAFYYARLQYKF